MKFFLKSVVGRDTQVWINSPALHDKTKAGGTSWCLHLSWKRAGHLCSEFHFRSDCKLTISCHLTANHWCQWYMQGIWEIQGWKKAFSKVYACNFPSGPVVKIPPCNSGDMGSITGRRIKIPHAMKQLSPQTKLLSPCTPQPLGHNQRVHASQQKIAHEAMKSPGAAPETPDSLIHKYIFKSMIASYACSLEEGPSQTYLPFPHQMLRLSPSKTCLISLSNSIARVFIFLRFFFMWTIFVKVFIEFVIILLYVLVFWPWGM